jgi:hypothetical protein
MKTLADFKRALTVDREVTLIHHGCFFGGRDAAGNATYVKDPTPRYRKVAKVQTNAVAFQTGRSNPEALSWLQFPKASEITFIGDAATISEDGKPLLTYDFSPSSVEAAQ